VYWWFSFVTVRICILLLALDHCGGLFHHPPYRPELTVNNYHQFTYLKNWLRSQCFINGESMEGVETRLVPQVADFFDREYQKLFPDMMIASVPAMTTLRSS
jgi:hypothetical protein